MVLSARADCRLARPGAGPRGGVGRAVGVQPRLSQQMSRRQLSPRPPAAESRRGSESRGAAANTPHWLPQGASGETGDFPHQIPHLAGFRRCQDVFPALSRRDLG